MSPTSRACSSTTSCWRASGRKPDSRSEPDTPPDFVFYTGCNVLKTPHIALLALDVMDRLGVTYRVMGGPTHCCGVVQMRTGDIATSGRFAESTMDKLARSKSGQVISWCPSCHVQFTETTLPTVEKTRGAKPFEMTPFMLFLRKNLDRLRPFLTKRVEMRVALHRHPGIKGVVEAAEDILRAVPGVELVDLEQPAVGLMSNYFRALPAYRRELQRNELDAAEQAGVDALVAVYHADHRELCAHERDYPFRIMNMLEIVGDSMGIHHDDRFKRLKLLQDVDAIAADCQDLVARHGLDAATTRRAIQAMLDEQPLPLRGGAHRALQARSSPSPLRDRARATKCHAESAKSASVVKGRSRVRIADDHQTARRSSDFQRVPSRSDSACEARAKWAEFRWLRHVQRRGRSMPAGTFEPSRRGPRNGRATVHADCVRRACDRSAKFIARHHCDTAFYTPVGARHGTRPCSGSGAGSGPPNPCATMRDVGGSWACTGQDRSGPQAAHTSSIAAAGDASEARSSRLGRAVKRLRVCPGRHADEAERL